MRKGLPLLLAGLLLILSGPIRIDPYKLDRLLWIPLDNRPVNTTEVLLLGAASGLEVRLPPSDSLDWYTDRRSDSAALATWLQTESHPGDTQVIYTNNLLTGGLIASRDVTAYTELAQRLAAMEQMLGALPPGRRIVVHVLPRLLPTQFRLDGLSQPDYDWAEAGLLAERSAVLYRLAQGDDQRDRVRLIYLERVIPAGAQERYDQLIAANQAITERLLAWAEAGLVTEVIIGLDDAAPTGMANLVHERVAQAAVSAGIGDRVYQHYGADEIGFLLLAREATTRAGVVPALDVHYDQAGAPDLLLPYEGASLAQSVDQKLAYLGAAAGRGAHAQLFVHTVQNGAASPTVDAMVGARAQGHALTLIDVTDPGERDADLLLALRARIPLAGINYAGWNTASNALGTGMAMALLSDLHRQQGAAPRAAIALETFRTLRFGYDWVYQSHKPKLAAWAREQGIDPTRFGAGRPAMEQYLVTTVLPELHARLADIMGSTQVTAAGRTYGLCVERPHLAFHWDRLFEVQLQPVLRLDYGRGIPCLSVQKS